MKKEKGDTNMNCKRKVLSVILLTLALTLGVNVAVLPTRAQEGPKIFVYPENNLFSTETTVVGDTFTVSVNTTGWVAPGPYGYEFKVFYDPTLLTIVDAEYPDGHFFADVSSFEVDPIIEANYVTFASIITEDLPEGVTGSGVFSQVTFEIIQAPPPDLSCDLEIGDLDFLDYDGNSLLVEIVSGYYAFTLPKAPVHLEVTPPVVSAAEVDAQVTVDIAINELRAEDKLVALEWKLKFNASLLGVVDAIEGAFLKAEAERAADETGDNYGTEFGYQHDSGTDFVICFSLYYRLPWPPEVFPEGSGTLATITFKAIQMPEELTSTDLEFLDVTMLDVDGNEIKYSPVKNGVYMAPTELGDLNQDRKINIQDLYIFGKAFGSYPAHSRWDARADIDGDGKVGIIDGVVIAKAFHP